jgi:hypothetical protein
MKKLIFCSLVVMLAGCVATENETKWVNQATSEKNKQKVMLDDCKVLANKKAGEAPISQPLLKCSTRFDPSCSFSQNKIKEQNKEAQEDWQQVFDSAIQSCMNDKGYDTG